MDGDEVGEGDRSRCELIIFLVVIGWVLCGFLSYVFELGANTHRWPYFEHFRFCFTSSFFGPFGLFAVLVVHGFKHWRLKPLTKAEAWTAHQRAFSSLNYSYFEESYD